MALKIGEIVTYQLSAADAASIHAQREGAGAFNPAAEGDWLPAVVVRVWPHEFGDGCGYNLQVFLDGADTYWATSREQADGPRTGACWQ